MKTFPQIKAEYKEKFGAYHKDNEWLPDTSPVDVEKFIEAAQTAAAMGAVEAEQERIRLALWATYDENDEVMKGGAAHIEKALKLQTFLSKE